MNFYLPVVSPDRGVVLHYPVARIGAMLSAHPVTQWWRQGSASSKRCWAGRSASLTRECLCGGLGERLPDDLTPGCSEHGQSCGYFSNSLTFLVPLPSIPHCELRNQDSGRQREAFLLEEEGEHRRSGQSLHGSPTPCLPGNQPLWQLTSPAGPISSPTMMQ